MDRAKVRANQTVLIHGGAGGVGHVAIQIAQAFGARVFATVSPEKRPIVEGFGASPIDYRATSVEQYVGSCTEGRVSTSSMTGLAAERWMLPSQP